MMKRDLYEEWIHNEVLEKGFQEPLWGRVLKESEGDQIAAKGLYLERRKAELIQQNFTPPSYDTGGEMTRVPRRTPPPLGFVERHPTLVRCVGFGISGLLIFGGLWMTRKFGLK